MHIYDNNGEPRYFGTYAATVIDNADPERLGRVRFRIEGLIEPKSGWANPKGAIGGGSAQRGTYDVPARGATITASFLAGDIDQPVFEGGWHGQGEALTGAPSPENASKVKIFETARWLITVGEVGGSEQLSILDKSAGEQIRLTPGNVQIEGPAVTVGTAASAQPSLLAQTYRTAEGSMNTAASAALQLLITAAVGPLGALNPGLTALKASVDTFEAAGGTFLSPDVKNS